jgi:hypothetical protein
VSLPDTVLRAGGWAAERVHAVVDAAGLLGPETTGWNELRRSVLPVVDSCTGGLIDTVRPAEPRRYAGTLAMPEREAGELLASSGFERNPFAALKTRDGDPEVGSWVLRDDDGDRQVHAVLFDGEDGTDVYVHEEYSSVDPAVAPRHYRGHGVDDEYGVAMVQALYPDLLGADEGHEAGDRSLVDSLGASPGPGPTGGPDHAPGGRPVATDGGETNDPAA